VLHSSLRRRGLPVAVAAALASAAATVAALALAAGSTPAAAALLCELAGPPAAAAALAVMAPCLMQLSGALVAASAGLAASSSGPPWRAGLAFAAGFLGVYAAAALAVGLLGQTLAALAPLLQAAGGLLLAALGLAVLRVLPARALSGCRGPRWLILTGRANLRRPLGAGAAFAVYCLGCCGPFLGGIALLGAGAGPGLQGAALVAWFGLLMGAVLLLPVAALGASRRLQAALQRHGQPVALAAGAALVALGVALALQPLLLATLAQG
jgi:cytochrome c biogenesis protein CcdA